MALTATDCCHALLSTRVSGAITVPAISLPPLLQRGVFHAFCQCGAYSAFLRILRDGAACHRRLFPSVFAGFGDSRIGEGWVVLCMRLRVPSEGLMSAPNGAHRGPNGRSMPARQGR